MTTDRPTPWSIIFEAPGFDLSAFELIREQVQAQPARSATELFMLPAAGTLLRDLLPSETEGAAHREAVQQVTALLFHSFRYWLHGRRTWEIGEAPARALLTPTGAAGGPQAVPPGPAGYLQLPRNLLWARVAADVAPEPVDGFFWSAPTEEEGARSPRLDVLLALGVRAGRPGISVVDVSVEAAEDLQQWADVEARPGGTDFENILPGGELQGYHALLTRTEVLKLAVRCFRAVAAADVPAPPEGGRVVLDG
jgi:hypothetical protein